MYFWYCSSCCYKNSSAAKILLLPPAPSFNMFVCWYRQRGKFSGLNSAVSAASRNYSEGNGVIQDSHRLIKKWWLSFVLPFRRSSAVLDKIPLQWYPLEITWKSQAKRRRKLKLLLTAQLHLLCNLYYLCDCPHSKITENIQTTKLLKSKNK